MLMHPYIASLCVFDVCHVVLGLMPFLCGSPSLSEGGGVPTAAGRVPGAEAGSAEQDILGWHCQEAVSGCRGTLSLYLSYSIVLILYCI